MQNQITQQENMTTYFDNLTVNFNSYVGIDKTR